MREDHFRLIRHQQKLLPVDHMHDAHRLEAAGLTYKKVRDRQPLETRGSLAALRDLSSVGARKDVGAGWRSGELIEVFGVKRR